MDGTKQFHHKTRHGCAQCKKRRVRCDLRPPVCSNCWKRDETCTYQLQSDDIRRELDLTSQEHNVTTGGISGIAFIVPRAICENPLNKTGAQNNSRASKSSNVPILRQPCNPTITDDLGTVLIEHYVAWTSLEVLSIIEPDPSWRLETIRAATIYPFLRHSLLALSGLHMCHKNLTNSLLYYHAACYHSIKASKLFREAVAELRTEDWIGIGNFIINSIIFNYDVSFLSQTFDSSGQPVSPGTILRVMRGPRALREHARHLMFIEPSAKLLESRIRRYQFPPDEEIIEAIDKLRGLCSENAYPTNIYSIRITALQGLKKWAMAVLCQPQSWNHFLSWPAELPEEYILILDSGDALACLIFVYWCAIMKRAPDRYYFAGRMKVTAEMAMRNISSHLDQYLEWPRKEFETGPGFLFGWMMVGRS
ncbi:hypothetical protein F5Y01DRAFT_268072 [Xylaria sp. FL0043]|nr:hypothetical protein F5Y01DRAFT_268072 [Xylaria sp. FL0043]